MTAAALLWSLLGAAFAAVLAYAIHPWTPRHAMRDHTDGTQPGTTLTHATRSAGLLTDYHQETP